MTRLRAYKSLGLTARFEKSYRKLPIEVQEHCDDALEKLLTEPVAPGLHLKPIRPSNTYWEARVNKGRGDRLVILPDGAKAVIMDIVPHGDVARWSK